MICDSQNVCVDSRKPHVCKASQVTARWQLNACMQARRGRALVPHPLFRGRGQVRVLRTIVTPCLYVVNEADDLSKTPTSCHSTMRATSDDAPRRADSRGC